MNGRSQHFPRLSGTPSRNQFDVRQPLYLPSFSPHMSPKGGRMSSPSTSNNSPDFIPLGMSSPVSRPQKNWNNGNYSYNSSFSSSGTSPGSNSSYSPYKRNAPRGHFRGRGGGFNNSNNSGSNSPHISQYIDREVLQNPWKDLEDGLIDKDARKTYGQGGSGKTNSAATVDSEQEESDVDGGDLEHCS